MAFVAIEDKTGSTELVVFPKAYAASPEVYEPDNIIMVSGKISARDRDGSLNGEPKIMVENAKIINYDLASKHVPLKATALAPKPVRQSHQVIFAIEQTSNDMLHALKEIIGAHPGDVDMYLQVGGPAGKNCVYHFEWMPVMI
ncbi:hypothetical protein IPG36_06040 [bacterium]|nr:MAG: hypothetical protein IPG36_06040 [bacterium]